MDENKKDIKNKLFALFAIIILIIFALIFELIILNSCGKSEETQEITETNNILEEAIPVWIETQETTEIAKTEETPDETYINETEPETEFIIIEEIATEIETETEIIEPAGEEITVVADEPEPVLEGPEKTLVIFATTNPEPESPPPQPSQLPKPQPPRDDGEKLIALTFDDGPSKDTERLLDILSQNDSQATFFIVGYKIASYEQTIKKIAEQGSEVAGHSWNHPDLRKLSEENIKQELQSTHNAIFNITGIYPSIYRAPYGAFNEKVQNVSKELGLALIQWNIDPNDWKVRNANIVYDNIMSSVKDGCIVVCHDTHPTTIDAMERIIPDLIAEGYKIVTVSELLQSTEPGTVYRGR